MQANLANQTSPSNPPASNGPVKPLLLDLAALGVDLSARKVDRAGIDRINPHRHEMALLDAIVWHTPDYKQGVAVWEVKPTEFWCRGHFPGKPLLPGVLQVEAAAQLTAYLFNARHAEPRLAAFMHIDECGFRNQVVPGDTLYLLCQELKYSPKRFTTRVQGVVNSKISFDALISGIALT